MEGGKGKRGGASRDVVGRERRNSMSSVSWVFSLRTLLAWSVGAAEAMIKVGWSDVGQVYSRRG